MIVATVRALKMHGGAAKDALGQEDLGALQAGLANLARHVGNIRKFGVPPIVAINHFVSDTEAEHALIANHCRNHLGVEAVICRHWAQGGAGTEELAQKVVALAESGEADFAPLYPDDMPLWQKLETVAREIYGADGISGDAKVRARFAELEADGYGPSAGLRGQDAILVLGRSDAAWRAQRPHRSRARSPSLGRSRLRRCHLRGHHDHGRASPVCQPPNASTSTRRAASRGCSETKALAPAGTSPATKKGAARRPFCWSVEEADQT